MNRGQGILHSLCILIVLSGGLLALSSMATTSQVSRQANVLEKPYPYLIIEQDLREVLREFGHNLGVTTTMSRDVSGMVQGNTHVADTAGSFLRWLSRTQGLAWYLDGSTLFAFKQSENETVHLPASRLNAEQRREVVKKWSTKGMGIHVGLGDESQDVIVTGPSLLRDRIASDIAAYRGAHASGTGASVTVYRGHAGSQRVTIPH